MSGRYDDAMQREEPEHRGYTTPDDARAQIAATQAEQVARAHERQVGDLARALDIPDAEAAKIIEGENQ